MSLYRNRFQLHQNACRYLSTLSERKWCAIPPGESTGIFQTVAYRTTGAKL